jgi:hypothetical protein
MGLYDPFTAILQYYHIYIIAYLLYLHRFITKSIYTSSGIGIFIMVNYSHIELGNGILLYTAAEYYKGKLIIVHHQCIADDIRDVAVILENLLNVKRQVQDTEEIAYHRDVKTYMRTHRYDRLEKDLNGNM